MFNNSGQKIKALAVILFFVCIIATLVLSITTSIIRDRYGDADGFRFWQFIGILLGGGLASFISSLFLYAFGDLVGDISILKSYVSDINKKLIQNDTASPTTHPTDGYFQEIQKENKSSDIFNETQRANNDRRCPNCGLTIHSPHQIHTCPGCGTHIE
ncbi:MAG: hypothetical protein IKT23_05095 [Clostridia bacterium]|nr:hypothetical protein [Clostridia bacterium]